MKTLNELTKEEIVKIIQNFEKKNTIFLCEAQFQFALAWEIQKFFEDNEDIQVHLESVKYIEEIETKTTKKRYTDIVIQDRDNKYIAIELKYKTKYVKDVYEDLKTHAAQDLGRYDFLWDTCRNENLVDNPNKHFGECEKAFSILLTNDDNYWKKEGKTSTKNCMYVNFALNTGRVIPCNEDLEWDRQGRDYEQMVKSVTKVRLEQKVHLVGLYTCNWIPYRENDCNSDFQFLIFEYPQNKVN